MNENGEVINTNSNPVNNILNIKEERSEDQTIELKKANDENNISTNSTNQDNFINANENLLDKD